MTALDELAQLFAEHVADVDSEPFAYEQQWTEWVGDRLQEVPRG